MTLTQAKEYLLTLEKAVVALNHAMSILSLDGETAAPSQSWRGRGETMAYLAEREYHLLADERVRDAIACVLQHRSECDEVMVRRAEEFGERIEESLLTPPEELAENERLLNEASAVWHEAKVNDDYASFAPYLDRLMEMRRRFARRKDAGKPPYDVLLDRYEKGLTAARLDPFFDLLRSGLTPVIQAVAERPAPRSDFLHRHYPIELQRRFSDRVMALMGLPRDRCAIAETEHPFTDSNSKWDVRISTHYYESDVASSLYSVVHEGGHALYELGTGDELQFTILGGGSSMSIHESQSRFYENLIGRSAPFCRVLFPILREIFPGQTADVTAEEFYRAVNMAQPSLIRTEADELTYPLHILVRYELEKQMMAGDVTAADLPALWKELYGRYLGVTVPDDRQGVLQDSHWAGGAFGYFPSYALGSAYGVQMLEAMQRDIPVWDEVAAGNLAPVTAWLGVRIHRYGMLKKPSELLVSAGVDPFDPQKYVDYLRRKFTELYNL